MCHSLSHPEVFLERVAQKPALPGATRAFAVYHCRSRVSETRPGRILSPPAVEGESFFNQRCPVFPTEPGPESVPLHADQDQTSLVSVSRNSVFFWVFDNRLRSNSVPSLPPSIETILRIIHTWRSV